MRPQIAAGLTITVGLFFGLAAVCGPPTARAQIVIAQQSDGSLSASSGSSCNNACSNVVLGSQIFVPIISAPLGSLEVFTSNFGTSSRYPDTNNCFISLYNQDTGAFLASSDNGFSGFGCAGDLKFSFNGSQPILSVGTHYRWDFIFGGQNFTGISFFGSATNTVGGSFSVAPLVNAKFTALAAIPTPTALHQFSSDGATDIPAGGTTATGTVIFSATFPPSFAEPLQIQVETRPTGISFTGIVDNGIATSSFVAGGGPVKISKSIADGLWHWGVRFLDAAGNASNWASFNDTGATDFIVQSLPPSSDPNIIAEQLDGSITSSTNTGCSNACPDVKVASQVFSPIRTAQLASIELFTANFSTSSRYGFTNICSLQLFNADTDTMIAQADNGIAGPSCAGDIVFSFASSTPTLQVGTHYRWDFHWTGNYTGLDFLGSPDNVVDGIFTPGPVVNAKFIAHGVSIPMGTISVTTNNVAATFTITDGNGHNFPGGGTTFTQSAPAGEYTITFGPVPGYITPQPQTLSLTAGDSITFTGLYNPLPQVLIVPGILGTKLASQSDPDHCPYGDSSCVQWLSNGKIEDSYIDKLLGVAAPTALSALEFDSAGNPTEPLVLKDIFNFLPDPTGNPSDVLDCNAILLSGFGGCSKLGRAFNTYDTLRDRLAQAGFTVNSFPYDWRKDLPTLGNQLYAAIQALTQEHPQQPVALVAHSMGGLVVSEMITLHPQITSSLSNVVTLGTPFGGSADAYLNLEGWESLEPFLSTTGTKTLGQYWSSPYFLLPEQNFVKDLNGNLVSNSTVYQGQFMPGLFPALSRQATPPNASLGSMSPKTLAIVGSGFSTTTGIRPMNEVPSPSNFGSTTTGLPSTCLAYLTGNGDGTVSVTSATSENSGITQYLYVNDQHAYLPSNDAAINAIIDFLSGTDPATTTQLQTQPFPSTSTWQATMCSPADISAQASNGDGVSAGLVEIQGASYISSPHGTQVTIPANDQYSLKLQGTGVGTFTLILTQLDTNFAILQTTAFANVPVSPSLTGSLSITPTALGPLQIAIGSTTLTLAPGGRPLTGADDIRLLSAIVLSLQLPNGISVSLQAKIAAASDSFARGDIQAASGAINAFANEVQAQAAQQIPAPVASGLLSIANQIENLLSPAPQ